MNPSNVKYLAYYLGENVGNLQQNTKSASVSWKFEKKKKSAQTQSVLKVLVYVWSNVRLLLAAISPRPVLSQ